MSIPSPRGFSWVVPDVLAAMGRPLDTRAAMEFLQDEGITVMVSLTEDRLSEMLADEFGFETHHIPIPDFAAPTAAQIDRFVRIVERAGRAGRKGVVHCYAGHGRTGTMLACYLVSLGRSASQALAEVRALRPGSVETAVQEDAVNRFARRLERRR